jgi:hypothetical protein
VIYHYSCRNVLDDVAQCAVFRNSLKVAGQHIESTYALSCRGMCMCESGLEDVWREVVGIWQTARQSLVPSGPSNDWGRGKGLRYRFSRKQGTKGKRNKEGGGKMSNERKERSTRRKV